MVYQQKNAIGVGKNCCFVVNLVAQLLFMRSFTSLSPDLMPWASITASEFKVTGGVLKKKGNNN